MIKRIAIPFMFLVLAACSSEAPQSVATDAPETPAAASPVLPASAATPAAYTPFPDGVRVVSPFHVRSDRIYTTKGGDERRRATLETLESDAVATANDIASQLTGAGFRALDAKDRGDGVVRLGFLKKGVGRINVLASADVGEKPSNPRALGVVAIDWPTAKRPGADAPVAGQQAEAGSSTSAD